MKTHQTFLADPRITQPVLHLPLYRLAQSKLGKSAHRSRLLAHLAIKLADAHYYCHCLSAGRGKTRTPDWTQRSRCLDGFIFAVYGALDAATQIVAELAQVRPQEEVKFPALARLLSRSSRHPRRWIKLCLMVERIHRTGWFIKLRRLRNLINHRPILPSPPCWPLPASLELHPERTLARVEDTVEKILESSFEETGQTAHGSQKLVGRE
jgi:hypothetical protein